MKPLDWAFQQEMSTSQKLALLAVAWSCDDQGVTFRGQEGLAERVAMTPRTLRRRLTELAKDGWITRMRRHRQNGSRTTDLIVLNMPREGSLDLSVYSGVVGEPEPGDRDPSGQFGSDLVANSGQPSGQQWPVHSRPVSNQGNTPQTPQGVTGAVTNLWERYVTMRARSPKKLRRTELDAQTRRMIEKALTVGSEEEWLLAIDALLHSKHNIGKNDRRMVYVEPRHIFTACTHGTTRQHLDYLLDISQTAHRDSGGNPTTSDIGDKIKAAKRNVLTAFDLAGSGEAQRSGDESERFLAEHGWRVEHAADGRPSFVSPPSSS